MNDADYLESLESIAERGQHRDAEEIYDTAARARDLHRITEMPAGSSGGRRGRMLAAAAAAVILMAATAIAIRARTSDDALTTTTSPTAPLLGGPALSIPSAALDAIVTVPAGWQTIDYGLARIAAPGNWGALLNDSPRCGEFTFGTVVLLGGGDPAPVTSTCPEQPPAIRLQSTVTPCVDCTPLAPVNGLRAQQLPPGKCPKAKPVVTRPCSLSYYFADLRLEIDMGVDADVAQQVLSTVTLSPQARVLSDGPLADTSTWKTVTEAAISARVPPSWQSQKLGPSDYALNCGGNPLASHENTVLTGQGGSPGACPPRQGPWPAHPADGIWITSYPSETARPSTSPPSSLPSVEPTSATNITLPQGTIQIDQTSASDHVYVQVPSGAEQTTVTIGIGNDPAIARTVLRTITVDGRLMTPSSTPAGATPPSTAATAANDQGTAVVESTPNRGTATTPDPVPDPRYGRVLFVHRAPGGHLAIVVSTTSLCQAVGHCDPNQEDAGLFIQDFVDGVAKGTGGGNTSANPVPPGKTILMNGTGRGQGIATVSFYVSSEVASVALDIRDADGAVVTDTCTPVEGVVAFVAADPSDFVSDARALDHDGQTIGSVSAAPMTGRSGTTAP